MEDPITSVWQAIPLLLIYIEVPITIMRHIVVVIWSIHCSAILSTWATCWGNSWNLGSGWNLCSWSYCCSRCLSSRSQSGCWCLSCRSLSCLWLRCFWLSSLWFCCSRRKCRTLSCCLGCLWFSCTWRYSCAWSFCSCNTSLWLSSWRRHCGHSLIATRAITLILKWF